ncbi:putative nucleolar pre-ribosomal-associated protein [Plasmopara halstedii]
MAALREFLLAAERTHQPLDDALLSFSRALLLSPPTETNDASQFTAENASSLSLQFLAIHSQCELLLRVWPDQHGVGTRWERRESFAEFLHLVTHLLKTQQRQDATQADALALRVVREKTSQLEKLLTWSDKPLIEFRALELLAAVAKVSGATARELVRLFNFQCPAFVKLATRRWKKPEVMEDGKIVEASFQLRAAYVDLVLALTACPDTSVFRFATKEGGLTSTLFKSLDGDSVTMLTTIFDQLGNLVLHNKNVEHKSKLVVYNATCIHQLIALLHGVDDESIRDAALRVLNALFFDHSTLYSVPQKHALRLFWAKKVSHLQREDDITSEQVYALKVIRNAIGTIGLNELLRSTQAQNLVLRILARYPGFLAEYVSALSLQLEPKPVFRWFCVASLFQRLLSCSLKAVRIGMPTHTSSDVSWCSAESVASRLIAPGNYRKELSRCIQYNNHLVIYSSLGIIEAILKRYERLASTLVSLNLASQVQLELRNLLPSPEALVSLLLKFCASQDRRSALIYVRALAVFRLYLTSLPQTTKEVKVDLTKILKSHYLDIHNSAQPLHSFIVTEMLRLLLAVDIARLRFLVTSMDTNAHFKLRQILLLFAMASCENTQSICEKVLQRTLLAIEIFGHDTNDVHGRAGEEVTVWLESLRQSRSKSCAMFMEELVRAVLANILSYVARGRLVITEDSSSLSPVTVALVHFLDSRGGKGEHSKLFAYRGDPCIVAFGVRILLALMPTSQYPHQFISLIVCNDAERLQEKTKESLSDAPNGKKQNQCVESEMASCQEDAYVWLWKYCKTLISDQQVDKNAISKEYGQAVSSKWQRYSDSSAFTVAVSAVPPTEFISSWDQLVRDCMTTDCSFTPLIHYLYAHPGIDLMSFLRKQTGSAAAQAFTKVVPVFLVLQHVLLNIADKDAKDQNAAIATVMSMVRQRLNHQQLAASDAAQMCEQLLWFFATSGSVVSDTCHQLCELLLQLMIFALALNVPLTVWKRILFKLQAVVTSTMDGALRRQLAAVQLVALRIYSSRMPNTDMSVLCDLRLLFQRAGVPLIAILASHVPMSVQIQVLDDVLHEFGAMTSYSPHVVIIARVIASLNCNKESGSLLKHRRAKILASKLWLLLTSQSEKNWHLSFFTTGFTALRQFGGVHASTAVESIENALVPLVIQNASTVSSGTKILQAMFAAIQSDNDAASLPVVFENHLLERLQKEEEDHIKCVLIASIYNVFARVQSSALHRLADDLRRRCYKRLLMMSQESYAAEVTVLRHVSIDAVLNDGMNSLDPACSAALKMLAGSKRKIDSLTSAQLLGLLFMLRGHANDRVDAKLLPVLVQSGLSALYAAEKDSEIRLVKRHALVFEATILLAENALHEFLSNPEDESQRSDVLLCVLPHLAKAREFIRLHSSNFAFQGFVTLTSIFLYLVRDDTRALEYDFPAHFDAVMHHPCFIYTIQKLDDDSVRIRLLRVIARLIDITSNYPRSLLQTLLGAYSMSLSPFDRSLQVLFEAFEAQQVNELTLSSFGFRFSASSTISLSTKDSHNDLVDDSAWLLNGGLELNRIRATIDDFPLDRKISTVDDVSLLQLDVKQPEGEVEAMVETNSQVYDPAFLLPMLSHFISSSNLSERDIVQQGLLGIAIRATSSSVAAVREYAFGILAHLHESLQATTEASSDFKAGRQVHLLLDVFRRKIQKPLEQVPSLITVFLNDALAVLVRPMHVLYPHVNHFLLARPAMDLLDVPMFYSLFNSRSPLTFRQERSWLLHTLRRGIRNDSDVMLLKRRHVLPMLLSFYSSEMADTHTQPLITSILLTALRAPSGYVYLVLKAGLLPWIAERCIELGAVIAKSDSKKDAAQLFSLVTLLEQALQNSVWNALEAINQHTTALQTISAFSAMHAAFTMRRTEFTTEYLAKASAVAVLVVRRAGIISPLELLLQAFKMVQDSKALECADIVCSNLIQWILQQRHRDAQKTRFRDWAILLQQVASILVMWHSKGTVTQQQQARRSLNQLKAVLDQVPTLKQHVLSADLKANYALALL